MSYISRVPCGGDIKYFSPVVVIFSESAYTANGTRVVYLVFGCLWYRGNQRAERLAAASDIAARGSGGGGSYEQHVSQDVVRVNKRDQPARSAVSRVTGNYQGEEVHQSPPPVDRGGSPKKSFKIQFRASIPTLFPFTFRTT